MKERMRGKYQMIIYAKFPPHMLQVKEKERNRKERKAFQPLPFCEFG